MFNIKILFIALLLFSAAPLFAQDDVAAILATADQFRLPKGAVIVSIKVELFKNGKLDKEREYQVYIKPEHRSLVDFRTPSERGQKVLMVDDNFWMVLPRSKRPVRITPTQKLLGEASTGDIATMTWHEDYDAVIVEQDIDIDGTPSLKLELNSNHSGTTYDRIELYVSQDEFIPIQASLYLKSGKLAKQAQFTMGELQGRRSVVSMILLDQINKNRETRVHYLAMQAKEIPDKFYNPAYLSRNNELPD